MKIRNHHQPGRAFTLVETLIALAFLASATGVALKMHQTQMNFDRVAMQRLTDQLAIENLAEQLSTVGDSELTDTATRLAEESATHISVEPFESGSKSGWHVTITIESPSGPLTHHLWRLEGEA